MWKAPRSLEEMKSNKEPPPPIEVNENILEKLPFFKNHVNQNLPSIEVKKNVVGISNNKKKWYTWPSCSNSNSSIFNGFKGVLLVVMENKLPE